MSHHKKHGGHIPPGNQPQVGSAANDKAHEQSGADTKGGAPFQDQDPKRRLGDFEGAGEHPYQQPGGKNDANH